MTNKNKPKDSPLKFKPNDRLQRLREWQQARAEAKVKVKSENKRPVFAVPKCKGKLAPKNKANTSFRPQISFSAKVSTKIPRPSPKSTTKKTTQPKKAITAPYSTKNAVLSMSPKPVCPLPPSRVTRPPSRPVIPKKEPVKETTSQQNGVKKPAKSSAKKTKLATEKVLPARSSARLATRQTTSSVAKRTAAVKPSDGSKIHSMKPTSTNKGVVSKKTAGAGKKPATQANEKKLGGSKSVSAGKKGKKSPVQKQATAVEPEPVDVPVCVLPTTPKKSYQPIHPSPLLSCRSATKLRPSDTAWIPGAPAPDCPSSPSFENIFSSKFSPFRFTAGSDAGQDFQFHFRMDIQETAKPTDRAGESHDVVGESENLLQANESTCQSNSSRSSIAEINDGAPVSELEDLITFSDTSDCSMTKKVDTPKPRRSIRNIARKCYSSTKRRRKSIAPDSSTSDDVDHTQVSAKKVRKQHSGDTEGTASASAEDAAIATTSEGTDMPSNTPTKLLPDSSQRKSRRSSRRVSTKVMEKTDEGVVRNLDAEFDKENNLGAEQNCGTGESAPGEI